MWGCDNVVSVNQVGGTEQTPKVDKVRPGETNLRVGSSEGDLPCP